MSYKDKGLTLTVTFENLSQPERDALKTFFKLMSNFGKIGHSTNLSFFVDGDGPVNGIMKIDEEDPKFPEWMSQENIETVLWWINKGQDIDPDMFDNEKFPTKEELVNFLIGDY